MLLERGSDSKITINLLPIFHSVYKLVLCRMFVKELLPPLVFNLKVEIFIKSLFIVSLMNTFQLLFQLIP